MLDYSSIKRLAKQIGRSTKDLVALAVQNDPFYASVPHRHEQGEWFAEIWHRFGFSEGVHLRRIHYVLVSQSEEGGSVLKDTLGAVSTEVLIEECERQGLKVEAPDA